MNITTKSISLNFSEQEDLLAYRESLSGIVKIDNTLFLAADESVSIERLVADEQGNYGSHSSFELEPLIKLPAGPFKEKKGKRKILEVDIEGLDYQNHYLWLIGSHSLKRKSIKLKDIEDFKDDNYDEEKFEKASIENLAKVESDGNRYVLARIPVVKDGDTYALTASCPHPDDNTKQLTQAKLNCSQITDDLKDALKNDSHLGRFFLTPEEQNSIAGKDNGFDIEGLVVSGDKIFVGLRGPVLRGWAIILEIELIEDEKLPNTLRLKPIGKNKELYKKHFLQLNGLGVRDLCRDGQDLLILAGPTMDLDGPAYVYRWYDAVVQPYERLVFQGRNGELQRVLELPYGQGKDAGSDHPEGITLLSDNKEKSLLVVYDSPSENRKGKTSVTADIFSLPMENTIFTGFAVEMKAEGMGDKLDRIFRKEVGPGWQIKPFKSSSTGFDVTNKSAHLTASQAWDITHNLSTKDSIIYIEPLFTLNTSPLTPSKSREILTTTLTETSAVGLESVILSNRLDPNDHQWSLKQSRVIETWARFFPNNSPSGPNPPGTGIIVGHPDTGYTNHPEIQRNLDLTKAYNFLDDTTDAKDDLEEGLLLFPGHGTSTSSVIMSPINPANPNDILGIAPGAKLVPLRVSNSVVLLADMGNLSLAIEYAADIGVHVISISMGGLPSWRLRQAIQYAQKKGVIILAAAGNYVGFVVWPAAFDEVIAVAGTNANARPWDGSSSGDKVDISAPAEAVWCAKSKPDSDNVTYTVEQSNGTSFAVATAAGIAALWLAYHGRDNLIQKYGESRLPFVFNKILRQSCEPFAGDQPFGFGAGIVNAEKVLATPLPEPSAIPVALAFSNFDRLDSGGLETFGHLFSDEMANGTLLDKLADLFQVGSNELNNQLQIFGRELAFSLASSPELHKAFRLARTDNIHTFSVDESESAHGHIDDLRESLISSGVSLSLRKAIEKAKN